MARRRYLDLLGSIYIYNQHRGYQAIDRVLDAIRAPSLYGRVGMLCHPEGVEAAAAAAALADLVASPERRSALGIVAREQSALYSWDAASAPVEQAYRLVLSGRVSPAHKDQAA
jgi:hypothetical protein